MTDFLPSKDLSRLHGGRGGPSFWSPINLLDLRLPAPQPWIRDLYVDWQLGYTSGPQVKLFSFSAPIALLHRPYTTGYEEILVIAPRFGEPPAEKPVGWFTRGGCAGLLLPTLDFIASVHHFQPSLLFADLTLNGIRSTEPYARAWGKPKAAMTAAERASWRL